MPAVHQFGRQSLTTHRREDPDTSNLILGVFGGAVVQLLHLLLGFLDVVPSRLSSICVTICRWCSSTEADSSTGGNREISGGVRASQPLRR